MTRKPPAGALPGLEDAGEAKGYGPVYQGTAAQIRALFDVKLGADGLPLGVDQLAENAARKDRNKGTIAQARSLAASIDRVSGHNGGRQASGVQLSAMHDALDRLLERLNPDGGTSEFAKALEEMRAATGAGAMGRTWDEAEPQP